MLQGPVLVVCFLLQAPWLFKKSYRNCKWSVSLENSVQFQFFLEIAKGKVGSKRGKRCVWKFHHVIFKNTHSIVYLQRGLNGFMHVYVSCLRCLQEPKLLKCVDEMLPHLSAFSPGTKKANKTEATYTYEPWLQKLKKSSLWNKQMWDGQFFFSSCCSWILLSNSDWVTGSNILRFLSSSLEPVNYWHLQNATSIFLHIPFTYVRL